MCSEHTHKEEAGERVCAPFVLLCVNTGFLSVLYVIKLLSIFIGGH